MSKRPCVSVFGSSRPQGEDAVSVGRALAEEGFDVACGGYGGTMAEVARGAVEGGGHATGVLYRGFGTRGNEWLMASEVAESIPARVERLCELGTAGYIVLPGGSGTLAELAMAADLILRGIHPGRRIVLLGNYWQKIRDLLIEARPATRLHGADEVTTAEILVLAEDPHQAAALLRASLCL